MFIKKKNAIFGRYPTCDLLNNAIRFIEEGKTEEAKAELIYAIEKAGGYFHEDLLPAIKETKSKYWVN